MRGCMGCIEGAEYQGASVTHTCGRPNEPERRPYTGEISRPRTLTAEIAQRLDDELAAEVAYLIQQLHTPIRPSDKAHQELALNHAYSKLAATGMTPSFHAFRCLANDRYSWAYGEFVYWAKDKSWDHVRTDT